MNVGPPEDSLIDKLIESRSFKKNPIQWSIFYGAAAATVLMFIILCALASWSISIGTEMSELVVQAGKILDDVEEMLPVLKSICKHENFTKTYGDVCNTII